MGNLMKKARRCLLLGCLALGGAGGCQSMLSNEPHATMGYSFGVYKQSVVVGPQTVNPVMQATSSGIVGLDHQTGMTGLVGPTLAAQSFAPADVAAAPSAAFRPGTRVRSSFAAPSLAQPPCDLQDVCDRLDRVERRLAQPPAGQKMPPGEQE